ncbi:MAG: CpaF family protein [Candidatus Contubernalis sp.]|nr:CpaF family protein [Candidatus Contubernalis sp.]
MFKPPNSNTPEKSDKSENYAKESIIKKRKELEEIAVTTLQNVIDNLGSSLSLEKLDSYQKRQISEVINDTLNEVIKFQNLHFSLGDKQKIVNYVLDEIYGFGPINTLIHDSTVTEIMVNSFKDVYVERGGKLVRTDITFRDNQHVLHTIDKILKPLGRRVDESSPMVDARLPDGSRVNAIIPPLAIKGPTLTIRKFSVDPFTLKDLMGFGTLNDQMAKFLQACVRAKINIIVSGGTGSGKTTTLNVLSSFIPGNERIVTVEDAAELQLQQQHVVTLEGRPSNIEGKGRVSIRDLVINCLRMRPDRIVVGEVRGGEALDMLQAMNTGHDGSITTLHANTPRDAVSRLETMVLMSGMELPLRAIREQISSALHLIIQQSRMPDGSRRLVNITEVTGMEGDTITLQDLFIYKQEGFNEKGRVMGRHMPTGIIPTFVEHLENHGEQINKSMFQTRGTSDLGHRRI